VSVSEAREVTVPAASVAPPSDALFARVFRGFSWNAAAMALSLAISVIRTVVLARLIAPREFGLFGMANTAFVALTAITTLGLDTIYVISKDQEGRDSEYLDTIWTADLVRRLVVSLLLAASALSVAKFYGEPALTNLVLVLALVPVLHGMQNPGLATLRRSISFARVVAVEQVGNVVSLVLAIAIALWISRSAFALIGAQAAAAFVSVGFSYLLVGYRPRLRFDPVLFRNAWREGRFITLTALLTFVTTSVDNVYVGKSLGATSLGIYVLAYSLASLPLIAVTTVTRSVLISAYAEIRRERIEELQDSVSTTIVASVCALLVVYFPIALFGGVIVDAVFGASWRGAAAVLPLVCMLAFLRGVGGFIGAALLSAGERPRYDAFPRVGEAIVILALLAPLVAALGIRGAAIAGVAAFAVGVVWRFYYLHRLFRSAARQILRSVMAAGLLSGGAAGLAWLIATIYDPAVVMAASIGVGLAILIALVFLWQIRELRTVLSGRIGVSL
jgi:O-antigen/teichoic acid export membrane protein